MPNVLLNYNLAIAKKRKLRMADLAAHKHKRREFQWALAEQRKRQQDMAEDAGLPLSS
jgi:hypothetical protein